MLISVNWLRDYVEISDSLDVRALAERLTITTAEVEGVEQIKTEASGLIAARIVSVDPVDGKPNLKRVELDLGGKTAQVVSAAPVLRVDELVVFAPPGASTLETGKIQSTTVADLPSEGMILPGSAIGIPASDQEAIFCPPSMKPGEAIDPQMLDDWVIEIDNKSITHRPDLWGHYGIAREVAAILNKPLTPYPVADLDTLANNKQPKVPITIDDAVRCPRYSALKMTGVRAQAAPLWMQTRLGHVGLRPIDCLVDLTNYIMADLGQPMHAFDGSKIEGIEVGLANTGETFTTLDGVERKLSDDALMIQSNRKSVAMAGIMGGLESEVADDTQTILLESANFEASGIRKTCAAIGLRTDASARFEKSLDPNHTVLAIQRFVHLASVEFPELQMASCLSDAYPNKLADITVEVDPILVARTMGHPVEEKQMTDILTAIGFGVESKNVKLSVRVPSYRATKDVSIQADIIEEIARNVGYDNITPQLPEVQVRHFVANSQHITERNALKAFCLGLGYNEVHLYIWYDKDWLKRLKFKPEAGPVLVNPAAAGQEQLRCSLLPGLLQATDRNRFHAEAFKLCEVGTVFVEGADSKNQSRHLGLISARRGKAADDELFASLKGDLETWAWETLGCGLQYEPASSNAGRPWTHEHKTAQIIANGKAIGTVSVCPLAMRRNIDEHLSAWSIAWAEINLELLHDFKVEFQQLRRVPEYPEVELDFSLLIDATSPYATVNENLARFDDPLLRKISYVGAYEGKSVPTGKRSLTYRVLFGSPERTLAEDDVSAVRASFEKHIGSCGYELRR
ncbi:MAG: phenylalanine--tRNA ligase beta subunit [Phycisphaerae bacterium]|nr:MAG: phenylalanine--tRNA ligase beta subunit [Phycisphaerae bacterium]